MRRAPAQRALDLMQARLHTGIASVSVVFTSPMLNARGRPFQRAEAAALANITPRQFPGLEAVQTFGFHRRPDLCLQGRQGGLGQLIFSSPLDQVQTQVPAVRKALHSSTLKTYVTGEPAVYADLENLSARDLRTAETWALPLVLIVLLLVFGGVVAAALPIIGGGMAVSVTLGVVYLLAHRVDLSIFVMNTASMLGLAVGIDYSLFVVSRFREELAAGRSVADAIEETVAHAGRAITFSGIAVVIGLLGLIAFQYMSLRSIGIGGAIVVFFSVAAALTLLPAILGMLGTQSGLAAHLADAARGSFLAALVGLGHEAPLGGARLLDCRHRAVHQPGAAIKVNVPTATSLPTTQESRQGYDILQQRFDSGALDPIYALLTFGHPSDPFANANLVALYGYGQRLAHLGGVASVSSVVNQRGLDSAAQVEAFWRSLNGASGASARGPASTGSSTGGVAAPAPGAGAAHACGPVAGTRDRGPAAGRAPRQPAAPSCSASRRPVIRRRRRPGSLRKRSGPYRRRPA